MREPAHAAAFTATLTADALLPSTDQISNRVEILVPVINRKLNGEHYSLQKCLFCSGLEKPSDGQLWSLEMN